VTLKQVSRSLEKRQNEIDSQSVRVTRTSLCRRPKSRKHRAEHEDVRVQMQRQSADENETDEQKTAGMEKDLHEKEV